MKKPLAAFLCMGLLSCSGGDSPTDPGPYSVSLTPSGVTLSALGVTSQLSVTVRDPDGNTLAAPTVTWSTSASGVATVSGAGLVTAIDNGSATITASYESYTATADVTVEQVAASVVASPDSLVFEAPGTTQSASAVILDSNDRTIPGETVTWNSSNRTVATVDATGTVTAVGGGQASVTARLGSISDIVGVRVVEPPEPPSIETESLPSGVVDQPYSATITASGGESPYAWSIGGGDLPAGLSLDAGSGTVSGTPTTAGSATFDVVVAGADALADTTSLSIQIDQTASAPTITSVTPTILVEGASGTLLGTGFAATPAGNDLVLGGLAAEVTAATSTSITFDVPVSECRPLRSDVLELTTIGGSASTSVPVQPDDLVELAVGEAVAAVSCINLPGGVAGSRYVVGVMSGSEAPSSVTYLDLESETGTEPGGAPVLVSSLPQLRARRPSAPVPTGTSRPVATESLSPEVAALRARHTAREAEIREAEREIFERLGAPALAAPAASPPSRAVPATGDTLDLKVPVEPCDVFTEVRAVTRHVGNSLVFLEDVDNPVQNAFTLQQMQAFDALYDSDIGPTLSDYFGAITDVDANGRVLILITKEVNEEDLYGFVWGSDLFATAQCEASNEAEIFYGVAPDPAGLHGDAYEADFVYNLYFTLITHEVAHIVQFGQYFAGASLKTTWETEGGATLAEQLVGFRIEGHQAGDDLDGNAIVDADPPGWFNDWWLDLAVYFGFDGGGKVDDAPALCSWAGRESEGNNGPCLNGRAVYGTPSMFLRMLLDLAGPTYPGGEQALMRELTGSGEEGLANLEATVGEDPRLLLATFSVALWADGRPGLGDWITSWNLFDVFSALPPDYRLAPYTDSSASPALSVFARALSTYYLDWTPTGGHDPIALRLEDLSGNAPPAHMFFWILRVQ